MNPSVLVAGIGNIFHRDDAFGVAVASKLAKEPLPDNVRVEDFGIRGFDLANALLALEDLADSQAVLVDATPRGGAPGTLYLIEASPPRVLVVGCEPATVEPDPERQITLSPPVNGAVDEAIRMIESLVSELVGTIGGM